jgi:hypothetical protein
MHPTLLLPSPSVSAHRPLPPHATPLPTHPPTNLPRQAMRHLEIEFADLDSELLRVKAADLLRVTHATVADVSKEDGGAAGAGADPSSPPLPLPWAPGTQTVTLVGVVAQKRKVAKLLQFLTVVPPGSGPPVRVRWHACSDVRPVANCPVQGFMAAGSMSM